MISPWRPLRPHQLKASFFSLSLSPIRLSRWCGGSPIARRLGFEANLLRSSGRSIFLALVGSSPDWATRGVVDILGNRQTYCRLLMTGTLTKRSMGVHFASEAHEIPGTKYIECRVNALPRYLMGPSQALLASSLIPWTHITHPIESRAVFRDIYPQCNRHQGRSTERGDWLTPVDVAFLSPLFWSFCGKHNLVRCKSWYFL